MDKVVPLLEKAGQKVIALTCRATDRTSKLLLKTDVAGLHGFRDRHPGQAAGPVILAGYSMGGVVVSQTAEYRPDKIKSWSMFAAFLLKDGESMISRGGGRHNPQTASYEVFKETFLC